MPLSSYNVNEQLAFYIKQYLAKPPSFSELKALLLARKPPAMIEQLIAQELDQLEILDKDKSKVDLENSVLLKQSNEDIKAREKDNLQSLGDGERKISLTTDLQHWMARASLLTQQLSIAINPNSSLDAISITAELEQISNKIKTIENELSQINVDTQSRNKQKNYRQERTNARSNYQESRESADIKACLDYGNELELKFAITRTHQDITQQKNTLAKQALASIYPKFLDELRSSLSSLNYTPQEQTAIRRILELMREHQDTMSEAEKIESEMDLTMDAINNYSALKKSKMEAKQQLKRLNSLNDHEYNLLFNHRNFLRERYRNNQRGLRLWGFLSGFGGLLTIIVSITSILAITGLVTLILPMVFYVATPLLLVATLSFAVTLLWYKMSSSSDHKNIQDTNVAIEVNRNKRNKPSDLSELETKIDEYSKKIESAEKIWSEQNIVLTKIINTASIIYSKAQSIEPETFVSERPPSHHDASNINNFFATDSSMPKTSDPFHKLGMPNCML